jgi:hypothetical protein
VGGMRAWAWAWRTVGGWRGLSGGGGEEEADQEGLCGNLLW